VPGELDDLYDPRTVVALDRFVRTRHPVPAVVAAGWRGKLGAGAIVTAAMIGVGDVLDPERNEPVIEEIDDDGPVGPLQPVTVHLVPGLPSATSAVVRPWLF
jgi:hypothetical protein